MTWALAALVLGTLVAGAYGVHRFALWAEARGWVYYKNSKRPPAPWLGTLEAIYKPEVEHVIEETSGVSARADQDESGEGDTTEI